MNSHSSQIEEKSSPYALYVRLKCNYVWSPLLPDHTILVGLEVIFIRLELFLELFQCRLVNSVLF